MRNQNLYSFPLIDELARVSVDPICNAVKFLSKLLFANVYYDKSSTWPELLFY